MVRFEFGGMEVRESGVEIDRGLLQFSTFFEIAIGVRSG